MVNKETSFPFFFKCLKVIGLLSLWGSSPNFVIGESL